MYYYFVLFILLSQLDFHEADKLVHIPLKLGPSVPIFLNITKTNEMQKRTSPDKIVFIETDLSGFTGQGYYFALEIGTPPQKLNLLIDTGSANAAVAGIPFSSVSRYFNAKKSSTYHSLGSNVYVFYVSGSWSGLLGSDMVSLSGENETAAFPLTFATITSESSFFIPGTNWEGILGLADKSISRVSNRPFLDKLIEVRNLSDVFSVLLCGTTKAVKTHSKLVEDGKLVIGGAPPGTISDIRYVPMRRLWFYEVVLTDMTVNGERVVSDCKELNFDKTIIDTGTTNMRFPDRVFDGLVKLLLKYTSKSLPKGILSDDFWSDHKLICAKSTRGGFMANGLPYAYFPTFEISMMADNFTNLVLSVSPQQYLRYIGVRLDESLQPRDCFYLAIQRSRVGTVLGASFIEGFTIVFDRRNKSIGFATSNCSQYSSKPGLPLAKITGPFPSKVNPLDCAYKGSPSSGNELSLGASIALGVLCGILFLPLLAFLLCLHWRMVHQERAMRTVGTPLDDMSTNGEPHNDKSHLIK